MLLLKKSLWFGLLLLLALIQSCIGQRTSYCQSNDIACQIELFRNELVRQANANEIQRTSEDTRLHAIEARLTERLNQQLSALSTRLETLENDHRRILSRLETTEDDHSTTEANLPSQESLQESDLFVNQQMCFQDSCYGLLNRSMTWHNAKETCERFHGHLVSIETPEENAWIKETITAGTGLIFWIGANDIDRENEWKWVNTNTPVQWFDWSRREPNDKNDNEDCVAIYWTAQWNDNRCNASFKSICEFDFNVFQN